jgi:ribonuclease P protein component
MLVRKNRLRKKKDFEEVLKKGKAFKQDFLVLKVLKSKLKQTRFGFIVSQKVSKKAVLRNKVKRRFRAITRGKEKELKKGLDIVIIALSSTEKKDFWEIKKVIEELFKRAKILSL